MDEIKLPIDGKLPNRWEIQYYTLMGKLFYWLKILRGNKGKKSNPLNCDMEIEIIGDIPGGDITQNTEIMNYIFKNPLNNKIIESATKGAPLIKLGSGSNPRVMITAGVHGNEIPPQIAALKLINELDKTDINGTVYVIPFVAPTASSQNSKLFRNQNLNLVAHNPGTPTNNVLKKAQELEVNSLADFHATSTHPSEDSVIYFLSVASSKIAFYVNKKSNSRLLAHIYNPGTLIATCNTNNIPTILCEVEAPDGTASNESIEVSYNQMKAFLRYHQIIT
ncbi:MAG TPA: succinylglutamate desuccinylase/aspartoacylase family protein [Methanobacterium sp.]|nr:succinylglutamate desuccinylase/aspartoacylase family protein [Methanobacterium sp.]